MTESAAPQPPAVRIAGVSKTFGATHALRSVSLDIARGTVHALVGENGAGKSTALGVIAGRIAPTSGRVEIFGEEFRYGDPRAARRAGVVAIYQELTIIPALSAEANVFLAGPLSRFGCLSEGEMRRRYLELCERVGVHAVGPRTRAGELSVAQQQVLEILRALVSEARIILFDEPTASLAPPERRALFSLIEGLKANGTTIMFVSHNLEEVLEISDAVSVFRDGRHLITRPVGSFTKARLVEAMIGEEGDDRLIAEMLDDGERTAAEVRPEPVARSRRPRGDLMLSAREITVPGCVRDLEIAVHAGEIVGLGGLVGSGRSTLLRALAGLEPSAQGRLWIDGSEVPWPKSARQALRYGIALVPEDRKTQGLVLPMSAMDNIALSGFARSARRGLISRRSVEHATHGFGERFGVDRERLSAAARELSGGNQQKLLLARWSYVTPRILLADEPTRGIDVGAKAEILRSLESMADTGLGLVIASSELEEVTAVADRVVVLSEGLMAGCLERTADTEITTGEILELAFKVASAA